ncbi:PadR family transcriptional regulator [Bacillus massilioanorexius]|uniref:PadR family transcriptional regulator n=1 Tax=Bacillus massilioanorexius TaxID=1468413 RepID=UPI000362725F|nr:PadR family transcriptional regulator [Bacillus massilioanorexius]
MTDSTYYILLALIKPTHGYAIMQEIQESSRGEIVIGPASLYTILKKLQNAELIEHLKVDEDRRKTYILTKKGTEIIKKDIKRRMIMVEEGKKALKLLEGSMNDCKEL